MHVDTSNYEEKWNGNHVYDSIHFHEEYQLIYIMEDNNSLLVGSDIYRYKFREVDLFGSNFPHGFNSESQNKREYMEPFARQLIVF
jgi:hypothetical protein